MPEFPSDFVRALPKAELHVHLEGSVDPATLLVLAERHGVEPPASDEAGIREWLRFDGFASFLERYFFVCDLLRDAEDLARVAEAYLRTAHQQGVVHVEFHVSSSYHIVERGADWGEVLGGVVDGCERAERDLGISSLLLPDISPHLGAAAAERALDVVLSEPHPRVVGLGMGGPADNWATEDFGAVFRRAREAGLHTVSHAGEHGGAWEVRHALDEFGAQRIQHGIAAAAEPDVLAQVVESGVACDVCPASNVALAAVPDMASHPLPLMLDAGVVVTLGSDDPPLFHTTLLDEYENAWNLCDLDRRGLTMLARNSLAESFAAADLVAEWIADLDSVTG